MPGLARHAAERTLGRGEEALTVALGSGDPAHLADIRRPGISLVEWWRHPPVHLLADDLIGLKSIRFTALLDDVGPSLRAALHSAGHRHWHEALADDVQQLADRFAGILGVGHLAIRLEPVSDNACRRFHADQVQVRLLCTYVGPGTEWLT